MWWRVEGLAVRATGISCRAAGRRAGVPAVDLDRFAVLRQGGHQSGGYLLLVLTTDLKITG